MKPLSPSRWLMKQKKTAKSWINLSVLLGILSAILLILQLHYIARIIDSVFLHGATQNDIMVMLGTIIGLLFFRSLFTWLKEISGFQAAATIRQNLRLQILEHLESLGPILSQQKRSGEWIATAMEQVEAVHGFFAQYLPQMWLCVVIPLIIVVVVFSLNWLAGIILLITAPLIPLFMALIGMGAASINQKNFQALSRMSAHFLDVLQGLNTLKIFNSSREETTKIYQTSEAYRKTTMETLRIAFLSSGALEFFAAGSIALLAIYLGLSLLHNIHIGQPLNLYRALFILLLAPEFFLPLRDLAAHYHARAAAVGAAEEIIQLLALSKPTVAKTQNNTPIMLPQGPYRIECRNISFTYPGAVHPVLSQLSLTIQPGEHLAIIGLSGSGKSTLLHLLLGFLQPTAGTILLNDTPLSTQQLPAWQTKLGWLSQQPRLFPGSMRDNLLLANPQASEAELWQALQQTSLYNDIQSLPQQLDTIIGEQNLGLSGGQAQRLALARLYLKKADILLLDEPTSSLDHTNQTLIMESLHHYSQGKTLILLTHRLDTLLEMDRVFTLVDGKLQEIRS